MLEALIEIFSFYKVTVSIRLGLPNPFAHERFSSDPYAYTENCKDRG